MNKARAHARSHAAYQQQGKRSVGQSACAHRADGAQNRRRYGSDLASRARQHAFDSVRSEAAGEQCNSQRNRRADIHGKANGVRRTRKHTDAHAQKHQVHPRTNEPEAPHAAIEKCSDIVPFAGKRFLFESLVAYGSPHAFPSRSIISPPLLYHRPANANEMRELCIIRV